MSKFQKWQKFSSIIPVISTGFVAIVTMAVLKRNKVSAKLWLYAILTLGLSTFAVFVLNVAVMSGENPLLNLLVSGLIYAIANIFLVDIQVISTKTESTKEKHKKPKDANTKWVVICCAIVCAVGLGVMMVLLFFPSIDIEDINGEQDTSLAVITRDELLTLENHYSAFYNFSKQEGEQTKVTGTLRNCDYEECSYSTKKISGVMTLQSTKTEAEQLTLDISSRLEKGNIRIVILVDGDYYTDVPINQTAKVTLTDISEKTVALKFGAESAALQISVKRTES